MRWGLAGGAQTCRRFGDSRHFCRHAARHGLRGLSPVSPVSPTELLMHLGENFGYRCHPVSPQRIGTTLRSLVRLIADANRLPVAAFWMWSLHQAIIGH